MKILRYREVKELAHHHVADWWKQEISPGNLLLELTLFNHVAILIRAAGKVGSLFLSGDRHYSSTLTAMSVKGENTLPFLVKK